MQSFTTALIFLFCLVSARASILKGFTRKEVPSLDDIPNIAAQVRRLSAGRRDSTQALGERALKGGSKSKSKSDDKSNNDDAKDESDEPNEQQNQNGDEQVFPYIPEAPPEFSEAGELSFVILMDEFGYNTEDIALGTKFAFSGRLSTDEFQVGQASGSCTIGSNINNNFALCTFYLSFNSYGTYGQGTVTLSGNTDDVGGYLQVTGTGADLASSNKGSANLVFDPAGNPIIYILIRLT